jgi:hypothetical protein
MRIALAPFAKAYKCLTVDEVCQLATPITQFSELRVEDLQKAWMILSDAPHQSSL